MILGIWRDGARSPVRYDPAWLPIAHPIQPQVSSKKGIYKSIIRTVALYAETHSKSYLPYWNNFKYYVQFHNSAAVFYWMHIYVYIYICVHFTFYTSTPFIFFFFCVCTSIFLFPVVLFVYLSAAMCYMCVHVLYMCGLSGIARDMLEGRQGGRLRQQKVLLSVQGSPKRTARWTYAILVVHNLVDVFSAWGPLLVTRCG